MFCRYRSAGGLVFWKVVALMTDYLVPLLLFVVSLIALHKKENAYDLLLSGAADGMKLLFSLIPALVLLLTAVTMLRASGAVELVSRPHLKAPPWQGQSHSISREARGCRVLP